ncbi:hypothetical protein PSACC_01088 [Paramicrosporidium saccamoebae]|uniref:CAF17 C-terminal domain-containing protein n=1 Tax=Paramicrosporidium saccamoebae TaxID=1246581 RepID=A0A2H9TN01_9FUNG|nr:hypothetical protein PSACC_01088 [Paramicrosporidium saccamoebae]
MGQELITRTLHKGVVRKRVVPLRLYEEGQRSDKEFVPNPTCTFEGLDLGSELHKIEPNTATTIREITKIEPTRNFGKIIGLVGNMGLALVRLEDIPPNGTFAVHRPHLSPGAPTFLLGRVTIPDWWPVNTK